MVKKKSSKQTIVIIILCILLAISIAFGITYSFYNGKSDLVSGTITTANLKLELKGADPSGNTTDFSISAPCDNLVPGNQLYNSALNIRNGSSVETYMTVVCSLSASKNGVDISSQLTNVPAIDFIQEKLPSAWTPITYTCKNVANTSYRCLVGINPFEGRGTQDWTVINVLQQNSISLPGHEWKDELQGCDITISITAYAIQADGIVEDDVELQEAINRGDVQKQAQIIATKVLTICGVDAED